LQVTDSKPEPPPESEIQRLDRHFRELQASDIPIKVYVNVFLKDSDTGTAVGPAHLVVLEKPTDVRSFWATVTADMHETLDRSLLLAHPVRWTFTYGSQNKSLYAGRHSTTDTSNEVMTADVHGDVDAPQVGAVFGQFLKLCVDLGKIQAGRLADETRRKWHQERGMRMRSSYTVDGREREPVEVEVPAESPVYGDVHVLFDSWSLDWA